MESIIVIGAVAAGLKAASKLRRCNPKAQITVIDKSEIISYAACGMPYYVSGDVDQINQLTSTPAGAQRTPGFFKNVKDITVLTKTLATKIDRDHKTITARNLATDEETVFPYTKLVIATGASPLKPPLPGIDLGNIYQLWHPDDAKAVRNGLDQGKFKNAAIIGAGLVGMEMAEALKKRGLNVTVIEMKDRVFPAFLDEDIAEAVAKYVRGKGISVLTSEKVQRFTGNITVENVETDQRIVPADLVILAVGVRPNVELARAAGLEIGITGAIAVNEYMQTSDPDIYAGGDCVETTNMITGKKGFAPMGSTANKQGRIIGENLAGSRTAFRGVLNTAIVKVMDLSVGKVGLNEQNAKENNYDFVTVMVTNHDRPHYMPGAKPITLKLIVDIKTRKLLGAQAFGEGEIAKRIDVIAATLTLGGTIDDLFAMDLAYAPPYSNPIDNVAIAANSMMNKLAGALKGISTIEAKEKMKTGKTVFLDVRSPDECKAIRIAGCENICYIPLGELRKRCSELNKDDEIVAFCKISLRGYEAALILEGEDFNNVCVMEGGILAWPFACETGENK